MEAEDYKYGMHRQAMLDSKPDYLVSMLMGKVSPGAYERSKPKRASGNIKTCKAANLARHNQAVERYKAVMQGKGWLRSNQIASLLGLVPSACHDSLKHYHELGLVVRQAVGEHYVKSRGYEWRWV